MNGPFVSILMLTYNAPKYVETSIRTVREKTRGVRYELVVVDNASDPETIALVERLEAEGLIDRLVLSPVNTLFAGGNNVAATHASPGATHYLLLNSDIEVKSDDWLAHLLHIHERGITSYGIAAKPDRVDGYCLLIDADLYNARRLSEDHQWWWAVTKLQAEILCAGHSVKGYDQHEQYLHHFGGKSGDGFKNAKGMNVPREVVMGWFQGLRPTVIDWPAPRRRTVWRRRLAYVFGGRLPQRLKNRLDR